MPPLALRNHIPETEWHRWHSGAPFPRRNAAAGAQESHSRDGMAPLALWGPIPETEWHLNRGISLSQIIGHRLGATLAVDRGGDDATRVTGTLAAGEQAPDRHMLVALPVARDPYRG